MRVLRGRSPRFAKIARGVQGGLPPLRVRRAEPSFSLKERVWRAEPSISLKERGHGAEPLQFNIR